METLASSEAENTSTAKSGSRAVDSSTPQSFLGNDKNYATAASDTTSETNNDGLATETGKTNNKGLTKVTSDTTGYSGAQSDLLNRFRSTFLNIDLDILNRLDRAGLFMDLWSSGDDYFRTERNYGTYPTSTAYGLYPGF